VPAAAAAAAAGVSLAQSDLGEQRRLMVWQLVTALATRLNLAESPRSAIIPLQIGDESRAVATAAALRERGIFIPAIRYPTVARGRARLRLTLTANHVSSDLEQLAAALAEISSKSAEFF